MNCEGNCKKKPDQLPLKDFPVAMAYVPWQEWEKLDDIDEGFANGTIFRQLNKPFHGCK